MRIKLLGPPPVTFKVFVKIFGKDLSCHLKKVLCQKQKKKEMLILTKHEMDCSVKEDNWNPAQDCEVHIKKN